MRRRVARRPTPRPADEELACHACDERYDFGNSCPDCDVELVSISLSEQPDVVPQSRLNPLMVAVTFALGAALGAMSIWWAVFAVIG
jgi:hypothetical protein